MAITGVQRAIDGTLYLGWQLSVASAGFQGLVMLISQGAMALVLWYGATLVLNGHMTSGELTSFLLYTVQIAAAFGFLSGIFVSFAQALGASERVFELMAREPGLPVALPPMGDLTATKDLRKEMPEEKAYLVSTVPRSSLDSCVKLKFEDVHFRYPSRPDDPVLKGISFELQPGSVSALVGPSGGGKSTIVGLIERWYDPEQGRITMNGKNITDLDCQFYRSHISLVSQEPTLFATSIADNIRYGRADASMDEVISAAKVANAHAFISELSEGYETMVGERGVRLSGGQKQRIAIARALLPDPRLLLLDEATSALDAESEHIVQEALDRAIENRTVLVIAHRLSTVRSASTIMVVAKGRLEESGSHDVLLSRPDSMYKKLVERQ
ncbi:hypothetical protein CYMTET_52291, partial [Cymbomonas tetramitiformis]